MAAVTFNFIMVVLGLVSVWYLLKTYRLIKSFAFLLLAASMVYLSLYRLFLPLYPQATAYGLAGPFYLGVAVACGLLYRTLARVLRGSRPRSQGVIHGQNRSPAWIVYVVIGFALVVVLIGLLLEIWELFGG